MATISEKDGANSDEINVEEDSTLINEDHSQAAAPLDHGPGPNNANDTTVQGIQLRHRVHRRAAYLEIYNVVSVILQAASGAGGSWISAVVSLLLPLAGWYGTEKHHRGALYTYAACTGMCIVLYSCTILLLLAYIPFFSCLCDDDCRNSVIDSFNATTTPTGDDHASRALWVPVGLDEIGLLNSSVRFARSLHEEWEPLPDPGSEDGNAPDAPLGPSLNDAAKDMCGPSASFLLGVSIVETIIGLVLYVMACSAACSLLNNPFFSTPAPALERGIPIWRRLWYGPQMPGRLGQPNNRPNLPPGNPHPANLPPPDAEAPPSTWTETVEMVDRVRHGARGYGRVDEDEDDDAIVVPKI